MCHRLAKFELYRIIRTRWNFELFDKKASTIFDKASTPFWNMFSVAKTNVWCLSINQKTSIFQCSKNYRNPTRETNFKVAVKRGKPEQSYEKNARTLNSILVPDIHLIFYWFNSLSLSVNVKWRQQFFFFFQNIF